MALTLGNGQGIEFKWWFRKHTVLKKGISVYVIGI